MPQKKRQSLKERVLPGAKTPDINEPVPTGGYHRVSTNIEDRRSGPPSIGEMNRNAVETMFGYQPDLNNPVVNRDIFGLEPLDNTSRDAANMFDDRYKAEMAIRPTSAIPRLKRRRRF